jgi:hypothetical protein
VVVADDSYIDRVAGRELALPLLQATAGGDEGELGIQRQKHKLAELMFQNLVDSLLGKRMPVTHGYENMRVERIAQLAFEPAGLKFRQFAEGRPAANLGIVFLDSPGTPRRNKSGQRLAGQPSKREVDDIRITEEVIEERLDRLKGVRPP